MAFIKRNIALGSRIGEIYREDRWEYPLEAIREAIINAVVHPETLNYPEIELVFQENGHAFQVQFIKKQFHTPQITPLDTGQVAGQVTGQVTDQVSQDVLRFLGILHGEMTRLRIQDALGLKGRSNFESRYLKPALADGLIELTIPDKPSSSKQKYRLTERGRSIVKKS